MKLTLELRQLFLNVERWHIVICDEHHTFRVSIPSDEAIYMPLLRVIAPDPEHPGASKIFLWCKRASDSALHIFCEDRPPQVLSWGFEDQV